MGNWYNTAMKYRLMFKSNINAEETELVLTQVMNNFNSHYPAVISIKAFLLADTDLSKALLSDEIEFEFENKKSQKSPHFRWKEQSNLRETSRSILIFSTLRRFRSISSTHKLSNIDLLIAGLKLET
jgi:hypothetical protein